MAIQQISIFLENKEGKLAETVKTISAANVNIRALCVADTKDFGILRLITSDNDAAKAALRETGVVIATDVIAAKMDDTAGALSGILQILAEAKINIEYMYAFLGGKKDEAYMIFKVDDPKTASSVLGQKGIPTVSQEEISNI